jgi:CRP-like cAMP-binding protein
VFSIWVLAMNPKLNELLDQLPDADYQKLLPNLRLISLVSGQELYAPGAIISRIYFPVTTAVALAKVIASGQAIDTAIIGSDGLVGLRGLDRGVSAHRFHVTTSGFAYVIDRSSLLQESRIAPAIYRMCLQAGLQMILKMSVEMACAHFHGLEQRVAKWILIRHDLCRCAPVRATHQTIADSLGVRREAVTNTFRKLRGISISRSAIEVEDRALLEAASCECYVAQREVRPFQRQLPLFTDALEQPEKSAELGRHSWWI